LLNIVKKTHKKPTKLGHQYCYYLYYLRAHFVIGVPIVCSQKLEPWLCQCKRCPSKLVNWLQICAW